MSLIPCDFCHRRVTEKLSQVTWAWYRADGDRSAWRQRLCTQCFCTNVLPLDKPLDLDELHCPACGISTQHDLDACYMTAYIPGSGKLQLELATCPSCAVEIRGRAQEGAVKLDNRPAVVGPEGGPTTHAGRSDPWAQLGIGHAE